MKLNQELDKSLELLDVLLSHYSEEEFKEEMSKYEENIGITVREYFYLKTLEQN
jgi:hypothetical protein